MNNIQILDCTLRDGGYCNNWKFGSQNIKKILKNLVDADIDIIECGFITNRVSYDQDSTKFLTIQDMTSYMPSNGGGKIFVAMMNFGEYDIASLPVCDETIIEGIRVAFHKEHMKEAIRWCKCIDEKGYKVYIQPMVSLNYSEQEFRRLIQECNDCVPNAEAFYIVDSFGGMKKKELLHLFHLAEDNLKTNIKIGFHSHNNMQMAYANAQILAEIPTSRDIIVDTSVMGMGRGAGNLNTELFVEYLNDERNANYQLEPLLELIDQVLAHFYYERCWGYSLPNYLSAKYNTHPSYANYLSDKNTLTVAEMNRLFISMDMGMRTHFDKKYIDSLYTSFMVNGDVNEEHLQEFTRRIAGKKILIIAPGRSVEEEREKIIKFVQDNNAITIEINFKYKYLEADYLFLSNIRRYRDVNRVELKRAIVTSNISADDAYIRTSYLNLRNEIVGVEDNAGMMLIKLLIDRGITELYIAGMDGYTHNVEDNYADKSLCMESTKEKLDKMNEGMKRVIAIYSKRCKMHFLTVPRFIDGDEKMWL